MVPVVAAILAGFFGLVVFFVGHTFLKLVLEPIADLRRHIGAIAADLTDLAAVLTRRPLEREEALELKARVRRLAADLRGKVHGIPRYAAIASGPVGRVFELPPHANVRKASEILVGLSNMVFDDHSNVGVRSAWEQQQVADLLGIEVGAAERISEPTAERLGIVPRSA